MKIAILTSFLEFNPGFSLTGIVEDQITMLTAYGHEVHLFVRETFNRESASDRIMRATLHDVMPQIGKAIDYQTQADVTEEHQEVANQAAAVLSQELSDFDAIFSHDLVFTGWELPYTLGIKQASIKLSQYIPWFHWIHSIPSQNRDWWNLSSFGPNHRLVYPNMADAPRVAEQYRCQVDEIEVIPHIKDPRTWEDFHPDTCKFIDQHPAVMQSDIVQILPAGQDRLKYKRVPEVISIFGSFKRRGKRVCLIVANQWATQTTYKQNMDEYKSLAVASGLVPGEEFVFTSDFDYPRFETGIPKRMIRELMSLANIFVFPTHHESFGLVVPEAALAGVLLVLNRSLTQQAEVGGPGAMYFDFGSNEHHVRMPNKAEWLDAVAALVLRRLFGDLALRNKTYARQRYNYDSIYRNYYEPILSQRRFELIENKQKKKG